MNQKRNLFVFVSLLFGGIYFIYFLLAIVPSALNDPAIMEAFIVSLPHVITLGVGVVFNVMAYKKYKPQYMLITLIAYVISSLLLMPISLMMLLPAVITAALGTFLKINQESTKFVGK